MLEQESLDKILKQLESIDHSIDDLKKTNAVQNRQIRNLKRSDDKTAAHLSKLTAIACIATLFFYFHNTTSLDENKKQLIENIIIILASGAGLNSAFEIGNKKKSTSYQEEEDGEEN